MNNTENKIKWHIEVEQRPFSLNTHYLTSYKTKFIAYYKAERQRYNDSGLASAIAAVRQNRPMHNNGKAPLDSLAQTQLEIQKVMAGLSGIGMSGLKPDDLLKLLPPDDMDPALEIMSDVRAYFQGTIPYPRFNNIANFLLPQWLTRGSPMPSRSPSTMSLYSA